MIDTALQYLQAGLCVLPANRAEKRPAIGKWSCYRERMPTEAEWRAANNYDAICIVCGAASGNVEVIDVDAGPEVFYTWANLVPPSHNLLNRLVVETTPRGGYHVFYRCQTPVSGNLKLAQRRSDNQLQTLIETRGEGGICLCSPTPGYTLIQGDLCQLPVFSEEERDVLLHAAIALNEYTPAVVAPPPTLSVSAARPGDDYNARGNIEELLTQHGWTLVKTVDENEYWRRPGKAHGWSATLKHRVFYVFSSNAQPFEPNQAYSPFAVYALLTCGGDWGAAAAELRRSGFGGDQEAPPRLPCNVDARAREPDLPDPGPAPSELLRVPGFVSEVLDYTLEVSPYPNQAMAFAGALALQAVLAGRKVRDPGDNRTNIYLLGLAYPGVGKDHPRKVNASILYEAGLAACLGQSFASGEGIQDALYRNPSMLFQTDEFDAILQMIKKDREGRHEAIMSTLLTLYSAANSVFPMRRRAEQRSQSKRPQPATPDAIDQPCLVIWGTAIPKHYYEALSERVLTNGLFARMIIVEAGARSKGQTPAVIEPPSRVVATAQWWARYCPGGGNLEDAHPVPTIVEHTQGAQAALAEACENIDAEYARAESRNDPVGTTVWGRVNEHIRKLALLYAISEDYEQPSIGGAAVKWAANFAIHNARRMLAMAARHAADNPVCATGLKILEKLKAAPGQSLPHSVLLKRMNIDSKSFHETIKTLIERGDVAIDERSHEHGRPTTSYRLVDGAAGEHERNPENAEGDMKKK